MSPHTVAGMENERQPDERWRSVLDARPPYRVRVLVARRGDAFVGAWYGRLWQVDELQWAPVDEVGDMWMPLPVLP